MRRPFEDLWTTDSHEQVELENATLSVRPIEYRERQYRRDVRKVLRAN